MSGVHSKSDSREGRDAEFARLTWRNWVSWDKVFKNRITRFGHAGEELDRDTERVYKWPLRTVTVDDSLDNGDGTITQAVRPWSNVRDGSGLSSRQDAVTKDRKKLEESRGALWSFMMYEIDPMLLTATQ
ncbi:hypothetical protein B484DRAFT_407420, partial [Ochromonadaceae sp. CCMP2298]